MGWLAAGSVAAAVLGLAVVVRIALRERPPEPTAYVISAPLSETTGWLLVGSEAAPLPPWSEELEERDALDLMTDERIP